MEDASPSSTCRASSLIDASFVGFESESAGNNVQPHATDPKRRIHALPGYRFRCDGGGDCCSTYGSVVFSPEEALAARSSCPSILEGGRSAKIAFTPELGSQAEGPLCVTKIGGRCAYYNETSGARFTKAGAAAKPQGCQLYPLTYFDDGVAIQLVRPECLCVFSSLDDPSAPALTESAPKMEPSLPSWVPVRKLPLRLLWATDAYSNRPSIVYGATHCSRALPRQVCPRDYGAKLVPSPPRALYTQCRPRFTPWLPGEKYGMHTTVTPCKVSNGTWCASAFEEPIRRVDRLQQRRSLCLLRKSRSRRLR